MTIFKRKNLLVFLGGMALALLFALSILVYFMTTGKGEERINLVLLGESGPGYAGATLTDSVIFVSVSRKETILVSVPRDLWYQPWQTKINSLFYYGEQKGDGLGWIKEIMGEILGQKIDRAILVDFSVFKDLVDLVGGVDVFVERTFDDHRYPLAGKEEDQCDGDPEFKCRYEDLHFEKGQTHFDGEQALKFVRSRYAEGEEGTDTARSARQQKVLAALKEKILSPQIVFSPQKIVGLKEIFQKRIKGDLKQEDWINLAMILANPTAREFQSFVIDNWEKAEGLIYHPQKHPSGQWVLVPRDSSWGQIHWFIDCLLSQKNKSLCYSEKTPENQAR